MYYTGSVAFAIQTAQEKGLYLAILLEELDDKSLSSSPEVVDTFGGASTDVLALRLERYSTAAKQFAEVYEVDAFPTFYLISHDGDTVKKLAGVENATPSSICELLLTTIPSLSSDTSGVSSSVDSKTRSALLRSQNKEVQKKKQKEATRKNKVKKAAAVTSNMKAEINTEQESKSQKPIIKSNTVDDKNRGATAEELIAKLRKSQALHREQREAREEEKKASEVAEKLRIAAEKAEKKAEKMALEEAETKRKREVLLSRAAVTVRLQSGLSLQPIELESERPLQDVVDYLREHIEGCPPQFVLAVPYPRRELTVHDAETSLRELNLAPSSVLLLIEKSDKERAFSITDSSTSYHGLTSWLSWLIYLPLKFLPFQFGSSGDSHVSKGDGNSAVSVKRVNYSYDAHLRTKSEVLKQSSCDAGTSKQDTDNKNGVHGLSQSNESNSYYNGNSTIVDGGDDGASPATDMSM